MSYEEQNFANVKAIACLFADLIEDFPEERHTTGILFDVEGTTWEPGCRVCAVGAALECLIPDDQLPEMSPNIYNELYLAAKPEIERRLDRRVSVYDIDGAAWKVIGLNDLLIRDENLDVRMRTFDQVSQEVRAQYACTGG